MTTERMNMIMHTFSKLSARSINSSMYNEDTFHKAIEKSLKELYIRKNTSSLVSLKRLIFRLLTVKMVDEICKIDSVSENYKAFILVASYLKYKFTEFVLRRASISGVTLS